MKKLLLWIVDHPAHTTGLVVTLTVFFAFQIPKLEIDTAAEGFMVEKDPARKYYEEVKKKFGSDNLTVILIKADDVFTTKVLGVVKRMSDALERIEGVTRVDSLATVKNLKGRDDSLDTDPLIGVQIPTEPVVLKRIREDALGNRVFIGNIVSKDGKATAIVVFTDAKAVGRQFNKRFTDQVEALIKRESEPGLTIYQTGDPLLKVTYGQYIELDQRTVVPIGAGVLFLILLLAFRTPLGVVIPMLTGGLSIVWAVGLMTLTGLPLNALTGIVPALLIAIGFCEDVHMLSEYRHLIEQGKDKLTAIRAMIAQSALPLLVTTATTVLGFLSLVTSDITVLIQFGYAAAMGLTANFVVTMLLLPTMLRVWRVPKNFRPVAFEDQSTHGSIPRLMERLGEFNLKYRVPIAVVSGILTVGSLIGWYSLRIDTDFMSYFPETSPIRQRAKDLHETLAGAVVFYVVVETGRDDGVKDPEVLRKIAGLQDFLASTGKIDKTVSVADYIRKMHQEMNDGDPKFEMIPDTALQVSQYVLTLEGKDLSKYLDFNASTANILVRHNITSSWELSALLQGIEAYVAKTFPKNVSVRYTGETILINNAADYMAINEVTSLGSTLLVIGLIHSLLFMSLKAGFLSLIPNLIPILYNFGLMGLAGIPLNTGTATVATVAIGIAVDDTVHHMVTYSRQLNEHHDQKVAMFNTMKTQGRPIIFVSVALAAGFFVTMFSQFVPTGYFGFLAGLVMLVAMVCELVLTPILMYSTRLVTLWDLVLLKMNPELVRQAALLRGLSQWEARKVILLGKLQSLQVGEFVLRKGETGSEMYMVVTGQVRVFDLAPDGKERTLTTLGPGTIFGEMALVDGEVRSANVIAESPIEVLRLDFPALERIRKRFPYTGVKLYRNLAGILSVRLRDRTKGMIASLGRRQRPRYEDPPQTGAELLKGLE